MACFVRTGGGDGCGGGRLGFGEEAIDCSTGVYDIVGVNCDVGCFKTAGGGGGGEVVILGVCTLLDELSSTCC